MHGDIHYERYKQKQVKQRRKNVSSRMSAIKRVAREEERRRVEFLPPFQDLGDHFLYYSRWDGGVKRKKTF